MGVGSGVIGEEQGIVVTLGRRARAGRALLAIVAITTLAVVLGACAPAAPAPGLVNEVNAQRAANGLGALSTDGGLTDVAGAWASHLSGIGALQHQDLSTIPGWNAVGETIEMGSCGQSDQSIVAAWMNSPAHRDILLSSAYTAVGIAKACGSDGREWVVADFGG
jgi:uncharacterized protein YkwD